MPSDTSRSLAGCPFCGARPVAFPSGDGSGVMIECLTPGCVNPHVSYYGEGEAAKRWNRRTPDTSPSPEGLVDRLLDEAKRVHRNGTAVLMREAAEALRRAPAQPEPSPEWREEVAQAIRDNISTINGLGTVAEMSIYRATDAILARLAPPPAPDPVGLVGEIDKIAAQYESQAKFADAPEPACHFRDFARRLREALAAYRAGGEQEDSPSRRQEHGDQSSLRSLATETLAGPGGEPTPDGSGREIDALKRRLDRHIQWGKAAREHARDMLDADPLVRSSGEGWWRATLGEPKVVQS